MRFGAHSAALNVQSAHVKYVFKNIKLKKSWIYACGLLLLIVFGFGAMPSYHAFREHQTNGNLAAAQAAERAGDWTTARDKARSVLLVRQDDFEAFLIWARARVKLNEPSAYMAAPEHPPAWREAIESLVHSQKAKPETDPGQTPAWRRAVEHSADSGKPKPWADPSQTPAWRKAVEGLGRGGGDEVLPPLPISKLH